MVELEQILISRRESKGIVTHDKEAEGGVMFSASMNLKDNLDGRSSFNTGWRQRLGVCPPKT